MNNSGYKPSAFNCKSIETEKPEWHRIIGNSGQKYLIRRETDGIWRTDTGPGVPKFGHTMGEILLSIKSWEPTDNVPPKVKFTDRTKLPKCMPASIKKLINRLPNYSDLWNSLILPAGWAIVPFPEPDGVLWNLIDSTEVCYLIKQKNDSLFINEETAIHSESLQHAINLCTKIPSGPKDSTVLAIKVKASDQIPDHDDIANSISILSGFVKKLHPLSISRLDDFKNQSLRLVGQELVKLGKALL